AKGRAGDDVDAVRVARCDGDADAAEGRIRREARQRRIGRGALRDHVLEPCPGGAVSALPPARVERAEDGDVGATEGAGPNLAIRVRALPPAPCFDETIGPDGTIYVGGDGIHAVWADGTLRWKLATPEHCAATPALGGDGTVYAVCEDDALYAVRPDGSELPGFPVHTDPTQVTVAHSGVNPGHEPILIGAAVGDLDHDGRLSIAATSTTGRS
ncbi:MAG: PQQ-binding-like beta-propeller repeat protein, partial [Chthoniobacterales bacterium]